MHLKEHLSTAVMFILTLIVFGTILGIVLHLMGFNHPDVTSWRYWLGCASLFIPIGVSLVLHRWNISLTSIVGRMLYFYASCITAFIITTCILERSIPLWPALVYITIFSILYPCLLFIADHPWAHNKAQSAKQRFTSKK